MSEQEAISLGYKMDCDHPVYSVLSQNGTELKAFFIQDFGWKWPTLHHPKVLGFIKEKANE